MESRLGESRRPVRILRRQLDGAAVFRFRRGETEIDAPLDQALCPMGLGEIRIQLECALCRGACFCERLFSFFCRKPGVGGGQIQRCARQLRIRERVTRIEPDRLKTAPV